MSRGAPLAEIGEVDAAVLVEYEVVRSAQRMPPHSRYSTSTAPLARSISFEAAAAVILGLQQRPDAAILVVP